MENVRAFNEVLYRMQTLMLIHYRLELYPPRFNPECAPITLDGIRTVGPLTGLSFPVFLQQPIIAKSSTIGITESLLSHDSNIRFMRAMQLDFSKPSSLRVFTNCWVGFAPTYDPG